jgi:outer membrane autotransporter protein
VITYSSGDATVGSLNASNSFALRGGSLALDRRSSLSGPFAFGSLPQPFMASQLVVNDTLSISGPFTWSEAGVLSGRGTTTLKGESTIQGGTIFADHRLVNEGNAVLRGFLGLASGVNIDNRPGALLDLQNDWSNAVAGPISVTPAINNAGTLRKSSGTGASFVSELNNTGLVEVQQGKLAILGGVSSGRFDVSSGAVLSFRDATLTAGSIVNAPTADVLIDSPTRASRAGTQISGAFTAARVTVVLTDFDKTAVTFAGATPVIGELVLSGGHANISTSGPVTLRTLDLDPQVGVPVLSGTATVNVTERITGFGWMRGTGVTNSSGALDASLTLSDGRVLNNFGSASGPISLNPGSVANNRPGASWTMPGFFGVAGSRFNNEGSLLWNATPQGGFTPSSQLSGSLSNSGVIELRAGYVAWNPVDSINTGTMTLHDNSVLELHDGRLHSQAGAVISGPNADVVVRSGGTFVLDGSMSVRTLTVDSSSTFAGSGVTTGDVVVRGTLVPRKSSGPLTVSGNVTFDPSSTYTVEADAAGDGSTLVAAGPRGTATINGGRVKVLAQPGSYALNTRYTVLQAAEGVRGTFSSVTSDLAFLTPSLSYDSNNVFLALARNDISFIRAASTANQRTVATALTNTVNAGGGSAEMQAVLERLQSASTAQARASFDSIGGASLRAFSDAGLAFTDGYMQVVAARQRGPAPSAGTASASLRALPVQLAAVEFLSDAPATYAEATIAQRTGIWIGREPAHGLWARAFGSRNNTSDDGATNGFRLSGGGLAIGVDRALNERLRVGIAIGSGTQTVTANNVGDSGKSDGLGVAIHASYADAAWLAQGIVGVGRHRNHSSRNVVIGGAPSVASAEFTSKSQTAYAEGAYRIRIGRSELQPVAAVSYTRLDDPGFTETGAGALNLAVNSKTRESARSYVGLRSVHTFDAASGSFSVEPRILWGHEFGNLQSAPMSAQLTGAGAVSSFQVQGVAAGRDSAVLGIALNRQLQNSLTIMADLSTQLQERQSVYSAFVGLRYVW